MTAAGQTVRGFVEAVRLELAAEWLATTDRPVAEASRLVGYKEASHFARVWRRAMGVSPDTWRMRGLVSISV